jgi:hypothetical protein
MCFGPEYSSDNAGDRPGTDIAVEQAMTNTQVPKEEERINKEREDRKLGIFTIEHVTEAAREGNSGPFTVQQIAQVLDQGRQVKVLMLRFRAMVGMSDTERSWMDGKGGETQPAPVEAVSEVPKGYLAEEAKSEIRFLGSKITPCLRNEAVKEDCTRTLEENNASVMEQSGQDQLGLQR